MGKEHAAVIILNYMSWEDTLKTAQSVHDLFDLEWKQIIIVDNASPNDSEEKLKEKRIGEYIFIETGTNKGYAAGNNAGLRYAYAEGYRYGWILNNDIIIQDENVLPEMIRILENDAKVAVVNPDIYAPSGYRFNRNAKRRSFWDYTFGCLFYKKKGQRLDLIDGYGYIWRPEGCCMLVDLVKMNEINYMDENTFLYFEESILAERIRKAGYKAACACKTAITHNHSSTVKSVMQKKEIIRTYSKSFEYYLRTYRGFNILQVKLCLLVAYIKIRAS